MQRRLILLTSLMGAFSLTVAGIAVAAPFRRRW